MSTATYNSTPLYECAACLNDLSVPNLLLNLLKIFYVDMCLGTFISPIFIEDSDTVLYFGRGWGGKRKHEGISYSKKS